MRYRQDQPDEKKDKSKHVIKIFRKQLNILQNIAEKNGNNKNYSVKDGTQTHGQNIKSRQDSIKSHLKDNAIYKQRKVSHIRNQHNIDMAGAFPQWCQKSQNKVVKYCS